MDDSIGGSGGSSRGGEGKTVGDETKAVVPVRALKAAWFAPEIRPTDNWGPNVIMLPLYAGPLGIRKL
jgi:hypothetical protein